MGNASRRGGGAVSTQGGPEGYRDELQCDSDLRRYGCEQHFEGRGSNPGCWRLFRKAAGNDSEGEVRFAWYDSNQFATVASTLKPELVLLQIERMPSITIVVDPVPPVDYLVQINGDPVRVNNEGRYRVDAGDVVVRVTRASRQDCRWKGNLQAGAVPHVACKL